LNWGSVRFFASYSNAFPASGGEVLRVERSGTRAFKMSGLVFLFAPEKSLYDWHCRQNPIGGGEKESE